MNDIEALAKELFTKWQVTKREKALVWEDLAKEPTGVMDDGFTLRHNFIRKAVNDLDPFMRQLNPGGLEYGINLKTDKGIRVTFSLTAWDREKATLMVESVQKIKGVADKDIQVVTREWSMPHANTGR